MDLVGVLLQHAPQGAVEPDRVLAVVRLAARVEGLLVALAAREAQRVRGGEEAGARRGGGGEGTAGGMVRGGGGRDSAGWVLRDDDDDIEGLIKVGRTYAGR